MAAGTEGAPRLGRITRGFYQKPRKAGQLAAISLMAAQRFRANIARMEIEQLKQLVLATLDDMKALDVRVIDVRRQSSLMDVLIIASGTSQRHVKSIAEAAALKAKEAGEAALGLEGLNEGEWVLVDLNSVVLHVMQPRVRDFYQLERLWSVEHRSETPQTA
jgi:ribosome-associated protein